MFGIPVYPSIFFRTFKIFDDDGNRSLNLAEFEKGIRDYGIDMDKAAVHEAFGLFDKDGSGSVDFDEFLIALRVRFITIVIIYNIFN